MLSKVTNYNYMSDKTQKRPSWDEYFIELVHTVAQRGTCDRGRSSALVVKDKRVLATGYAGSPPGLPHCDDVGHLMAKQLDENGKESQHCIRTIHAEQNVIAQAARFGISLDEGTLYCNMEPCYVCGRMVVAAGIKKVVCEKRYHRAELTRELFKTAGIELTVLDDKTEEYENQ